MTAADETRLPIVLVLMKHDYRLYVLVLVLRAGAWAMLGVSSLLGRSRFSRLSADAEPRTSALYHPAVPR